VVRTGDSTVATPRGSGGPSRRGRGKSTGGDDDARLVRKRPPPGEEYPGLYVTDAEFVAEMSWLHRREYDAATIAAVKEAGYVGAVTENAGYAGRGLPYELDRYEIEGGDGVEGLAADLRSGG
jgi:hypothetical protein